MEHKTTARTLVADRAAGRSSVPADALILDSGPFTFAAGEAKDGKLPVKMRARGAQPIYHWYWGNVVHDMAGFSAAAATIPIDYCHDYDQVLGFLNDFKASNEGLDVGGELVSFGDDRSSEVAHKARSGVPYQASIYFEPKVLEEVMPGAEAEVNGYKLPGPGLVIRKWSLRGVAVCPYGYDPTTSTRLSAPAGGDIPVQFVSTKESQMSVTFATEKKPDEKPATELTKPAETKTEATPPADPRAEFKATLAKFTEKFGAENGAKWAADGLSYEAALEKHAAELQTKLSAEGEEKKKLAEKLAAVPRGEKEPVSFAAGDKHEGSGNVDPSHLKFKIGENLARVAAGIKLPGKK